MRERTNATRLSAMAVSVPSCWTKLFAHVTRERRACLRERARGGGAADAEDGRDLFERGSVEVVHLEEKAIFFRDVGKRLAERDRHDLSVALLQPSHFRVGIRGRVELLFAFVAPAALRELSSLPHRAHAKPAPERAFRGVRRDARGPFFGAYEKAETKALRDLVGKGGRRIDARDEMLHLREVLTLELLERAFHPRRARDREVEIFDMQVVAAARGQLLL